MIPQSTANRGSGGGGEHGGNFNNFSANSKVGSRTKLRGVSADDGQPVDTSPQWVKCELPNWLRMVMYDAGGHYGQSEHLPAELEVPVEFGIQSRAIVRLDVETTASQLAQFREFGVKEWKETEAVLAPVRNAVQLPGVLRRQFGFKAIKAELKDLREDLRFGEMRDEPVKPKDLEAMRRTAAMQRHSFDANPKLRDKQREQVLLHYPSMAQGVAAGSYPRHGFEANLMMQEVSGILTPEEAAELRRTAGLG